MLKLISLNVGLPREVEWHGHTVSTGIFKSPVAGRIALRKLNLDGDRQADLTVHGGPEKAVYCYPAEHYSFWKKRLSGRDLPWGSFGENFTVEGLDEKEAHLGDRWAVGSAETMIVQPRLPCFKLGIRFGSDQMVRRFFEAGRFGFYLSVLREGEVEVGDEIHIVSRDPEAIRVSEITRLFATQDYGDKDAEAVERLIAHHAVPDSWKEYFRDRLRNA
jgi:MOSC domain-containing protein YiiM